MAAMSLKQSAKTKQLVAQTVGVYSLFHFGCFIWYPFDSSQT